MSLTLGPIIESLEPCNRRKSTAASIQRDPIEWYESAKASLHNAHASGDGVGEATVEFVSARDSLRGLFEAIWPGA